MLKHLVISFSASYSRTLTYVSWFLKYLIAGSMQWFKLSSALKVLGSYSCQTMNYSLY
jgi:hypothetical protein